ncbi:MAG: elongation factor P [Anaeromyxobacteraceae bacterium]
MADTMDTSAFRRGLKIEIDKEPWEIVEFQHVKPGKGSAFVRTRIKNLLSGRTIDRTFKSGDVVGKPDVEEKEMQFLYKDGTSYNFMDNKNFEQTFLTEEQMGDSKNFIKDNTTTHIMFFNGKAIGVTLPNSMDLRVAKCDPGVRGDTVSGATKPAVLETGYSVNVPLFINEGDVLRIDTRTGEYLTRVAG